MSENSVKTAVVLGSGGHTGEMIKLLSGISLSTYTPIEFIVADTDSMSIQKVQQFDEACEKQHKKLNYDIHKINRSRRVGQSYFTSVFSTLLALLNAIPLIFKLKPRLLLLNGPGTCLPICFMIFVFSRLICILPRCKIVFVESICRVKKLSLTGKLLYHLKLYDYFIVQWPELKDKYSNAIYLGRLV